MKVGIIGLPGSGKTTIFNALTGGKVKAVRYSPSLSPNVGVSKVKDQRLLTLQEMFHPPKTTPSEVSYVDVPGIASDKWAQLLGYISTVDVLLQVVGLFEETGPPLANIGRAIQAMDSELMLSDLTTIESRLEHLEKEIKGKEHDLYLREKDLLLRLKSNLEDSLPLREQNLSSEEIQRLSNYQFLSAKPRLIVLNIREDDLSQAPSLERESSSYPGVAICGKLEMELGELKEAEAEEFRRALGLSEKAVDRIVQLSYRLLGLISFFTVNPNELRAWSVPQGTTALKAAGKVHSDMERGFIRAEVITSEDLMKCGGFPQARKKGLLHIEGKDYALRDGDVINFLFHV
jgi:hypothetical protein